MYEYAYLVGTLYLLAVLIILVAGRKDRKFVLWSALLWAPAAPILEYWHQQDYWNPTYLIPIHIGDWRFGVEDFLFGLVFAGICADLFDRLASRRDQTAKVAFPVSGLLKLLSVSTLGGAIGMFILSSLLKLDSISAIVIIELFFSVMIFFRRPQWIVAAVQTAVLVGAGFWISYYFFFLKLYPGIIDHWWHKAVIEGFSIGGIPFEEIVWAMASGLCIGPVSRFFLVADHMPRRTGTPLIPKFNLGTRERS